jgi:hypothetical protein
MVGGRGKSETNIVSDGQTMNIVAPAARRSRPPAGGVGRIRSTDWRQCQNRTVVAPTGPPLT